MDPNSLVDEESKTGHRELHKLQAMIRELEEHNPDLPPSPVKTSEKNEFNFQCDFNPNDINQNGIYSNDAENGFLTPSSNIKGTETVLTEQPMTKDNKHASKLNESLLEEEDDSSLIDDSDYLLEDTW